MENNRQAELRRLKFKLLLPLLVLPFLTMAFWALGGGKSGQALAADRQAKGFDLTLPQAQFDKKEKKPDKLNLYRLADRDSVRQRQLANSQAFPATASDAGQLNVKDPNESRISERLAQINRQLSAPPPAIPNHQLEDLGRIGKDEGDSGALIKAMKGLNTGTKPDPEMQQLNTVMDKLLQIQHPETLSKEMPKAERQTFAVTSPDSSLQAVIDDPQTLVSGETVRMRLLGDAWSKGTLIPAGSLVYGTANLNGERLKISIQTMRTGRLILPVALDAYDLDGMEGLYVPGSISRDAAKEGGSNALQSMQLMSLDQGLATQAAAAGVEAAKGLFSHKIRLVRVTLPAGYKLLLRDENQKLK